MTLTLKYHILRAVAIVAVVTVVLGAIALQVAIGATDHHDHHQFEPRARVIRLGR